ncbi:hypothetical protein N9L68_07635 [bacterium]|nr:hypothetical protein [bacterium]
MQELDLVVAGTTVSLLVRSQLECSCWIARQGYFLFTVDAAVLIWPVGKVVGSWSDW